MSGPARSSGRRLRAPLLAAAAVILAVAPRSRADDTRYQDYPVGSRAMVLGGAFAALADDPSGLTYNPAGLCDTRRLNVDVSASLYGLERQGSGALVIDQKTFSLATLAALDLIPGEMGLVKSYGQLDDVGAPYALGFDVTVPSFRAYGLDTTSPTRIHSRVQDRTIDLAVGGAMRVNDRLNLGAGLHVDMRVFSETLDALISDGKPDPRVGVYHAEGSFTNASLVLSVGAKLHLDDGWLAGFMLATPSLPVYSSGSVTIQDVLTDPAGPAPHTTINSIDTTQVRSSTIVPVLLRAGVAKVAPHHWTLSGQLTFHGPASYNRFEVPADVAVRLQLQQNIERRPVLDLNLGGELLLDPTLSIALGFFTDFSSAPPLATAPDGSILPGTSRLARVDLYGGTASVGLIGRHSISRIGISAAYGAGEGAVANDPTGIQDAQGSTRTTLQQLFVYVFLASTFRY